MLRRTVSILLLATLGGLVFFGCATSSQSVETAYDSSSNKTTYRTGQMRLSDIEMSTGIQKQNRFYVQVVGQCMGKDCIPSEFTVNFIKQGPQSVTLGGRDVSLTIGSETITWEDPQTRDVNQTTKIRSGTFAKIGVSGGQLSTIGAVTSVTGSVGGADFTIPYDNRSPIRALLSQLDKMGDNSTEKSSS